MATVAENLQTIIDSKAAIKAAIEAKGVAVGDAPLTQYASKIGEIEQGGEVVEEAVENDVNFYDYTGFRVASYSIEEAKALTQEQYDAILPPTHEGLTFQEWNWTLADIQGYNRRYADIGAHYATEDGKCHIKIKLPEDGLSFKIYLRQTATRSTTIDWGDGTTESITSTSDSSQASKTHTYTQKGNYTIKLYKTDGTGTFTFTPSESLAQYAYEVNFGGGIGGMITRGYYIRITVPKTLLSFTPQLEYVVSPQLTIPKYAEWYNAANTHGINVSSIVCMPPLIAPPKNSSWYTAHRRLIIPEFTESITIPNNAINSTINTPIISISSNLAWASQAGNVNYFSNQQSLLNIDIAQGWIPNYNIGFSVGYNLLPSDYVDFFNKLGTLPDGVTRTITLGAINLPKLTAEEKAIATNKGYTLA
jgi:PKD repeat protein